MFPNLRAEMARKNVTGNELAAYLNIRPATFSDKKNGKSEFTFSEAQMIRAYLGAPVPLEVLFEKEER